MGYQWDPNALRRSYIGILCVAPSYWCHYDIFHTRDGSQGFNNDVEMRTNVLGLKYAFKACESKPLAIPIKGLFCL